MSHHFIILILNFSPLKNVQILKRRFEIGGKMKYLNTILFVLSGLIFINTYSFAEDYRIVDTGQDVCYDNNTQIPFPNEGEPFYGQDAQFNGYQPFYTINSDSLTVYDNNTGLTWIRMPDTDNDGDLDTYDQLTWAEFIAYPETLNAQNYGGYDDWRIPTIKELYSLIDFRGQDPSGPNPPNLVPFIDTNYFDFVYGDTTVGERIIDAQYWSSTQYVGTVFGGETAIFGVNFADGRIKGYPRDISPGGVAVHYARLVRGNTDYGINIFVDNGDGTITDNATGLMWMQDDHGDTSSSGPRSGILWEDALAWVQQKNNENYLSYNGWRLPNAKEMHSIIDYTRAPDATGSAAIDPIFNVTEITNEAGDIDYPWYWTGTTHARAGGDGPAAAYVCFGRALGYFGPSGNEAWTDVHGAGAQRSDKKDGNFSGYPYVPDGYYFGPQGDAIRMYNYVRCVRDGLVSDIDEKSDLNLPSGCILSRVYPNPFNSNTTIEYSLPEQSNVTLEIYNILGQKAAILIDEFQNAGDHTVTWHADDISSGIYFYRIIAGELTELNRMLLLK
jgi:hypothetical protein